MTIDDQLLAQLKRRAAESGTSVSKLVEQALRMLIRTPRSPRVREQFELVTFGAGGNFSLQNIDRISALIETDDLARFGRPSPSLRPTTSSRPQVGVTKSQVGPMARIIR